MHFRFPWALRLALLLPACTGPDLLTPAELATTTFTLESMNGRALPSYLTTRVDGCIVTQTGASLEFSATGSWALVNRIEEDCRAAGRTIDSTERNLYGEWQQAGEDRSLVMSTGGEARRTRMDPGATTITVDLPADSTYFWTPVRLVLRRDR